MQLLGIALQFVPALPRAQRRCCCSAAEVGETSLFKVSELNLCLCRTNGVLYGAFSSGGVGAQLYGEL